MITPLQIQQAEAQSLENEQSGDVTSIAARDYERRERAEQDAINTAREAGLY